MENAEIVLKVVVKSIKRLLHLPISVVTIQTLLTCKMVIIIDVLVTHNTVNSYLLSDLAAYNVAMFQMI